MKHYGDELHAVISQLLRVRAVSTNSFHTHTNYKILHTDSASLEGLRQIE